MREGVFRHPGNVRIKGVEKNLCGSLVKNNLWNEDESRGLTGTGSPYKIIAVGLTGAVAQWERASLARKRPGVRIPPAPPDFARLVRLLLYNESGRSAVWLAHLLWEQGVEGSNPFAPTIETGAGIAQLARAMAFQAVGRGFESRFPLHFSGACSSVG